MIHKLLIRATRNRPARLIETAGKPYMLRYYAGQCCGWTIYLHQFVSSDAERHLHNHPFDIAVSFVLRGRYVEDRLQRLSPTFGALTRKRTTRWVNVIRPSTFHRITQPEPETWTLFCLRRSKRFGWGF